MNFKATLSYRGMIGSIEKTDVGYKGQLKLHEPIAYAADTLEGLVRAFEVTTDKWFDVWSVIPF